MTLKIKGHGNVKKHKIIINRPVIVPDHGLMLGNGDISVSFYQQPGLLIWRFGKSDVWDRRVDYHLDPKPAHIRELEHGIRDERWCCGPYGGPVEALDGTDNPQRMKEICQGCPPSYIQRPYPCPKPVGELAMHFSVDLPDLKIRQMVVIEDALLLVVCSWSNGIRLELSAFVAPDDNILALDWNLTGWDYQRAVGEMYLPPVWFALYRHADRPVNEFGEKYRLRYNPIFNPFPHSEAKPLDKPFLAELAGRQWYIQQDFPSEATFPQGFRYGMLPVSAELQCRPLEKTPSMAALQLIPDPKNPAGQLYVAVESAGNDADLRVGLQRHLDADISALAAANRKASRDFWSRSALSVGDKFVEALWYETLYARRCAYRRGKTPPGLFFPSTVADYSLWHGDFHMNYNFQQPFLGDYGANHFELGDNYFDGMKYVLQMGKLIAEKYYDSQGTFVQLSAFPILATDDVLGTAPMGRMAYMTGWAGHQYYWRYRYSMDLEWLRREGYPVLRSLAFFYIDLMKKGDDGQYHVFPSNQGEDGFTGNPEAYTDVPQVMLQLRCALCAVLEVAGVLDTDHELQAELRDHIDHLAEIRPKEVKIRKAADNWDETSRGPEENLSTVPWSEITRGRGDLFPPEFLGFDGNIRNQDPSRPPEYADPDFYLSRWYAGKLPLVWMTELRNRVFLPERDWLHIRRILEKWRTPNGLLCAMSVNMYGYPGAWTEPGGIIAPLQECLLESWDGGIKIFPATPPDWGDVRFDNLRAEGAFLVSAVRRDGHVTHVKIIAERGGKLRLLNPFGTVAFEDKGATLQHEGHYLLAELTPGKTIEMTVKL